jgi:hypothetical protein
LVAVAIICIAFSPLLILLHLKVGGYYDYNLYDDCIYEDDIRRHRRNLLSASSSSSSSSSSPSLPFLQPLSNPPTRSSKNGAALNDYVCGGGDAQNIWATTPEVMKGLFGVKQSC